MIEARATVVRLDGDHAWVKLNDRAGGCGRCDEPGGCRSVRITRVFKGAREEFNVPNDISASVGEHVLLRIEDGAPLRAALAGYGLGIVFLLGGALFGALLAPAGAQADAHAAVGALAGLAAAAGGHRLLARSRSWRRLLQTSVVRDDGRCTGGEGRA